MFNQQIFIYNLINITIIYHWIYLLFATQFSKDTVIFDSVMFLKSFIYTFLLIIFSLILWLVIFYVLQFI
jgi:hypothetical protein